MAVIVHVLDLFSHAELCLVREPRVRFRLGLLLFCFEDVGVAVLSDLAEQIISVHVSLCVDLCQSSSRMPAHREDVVRKMVNPQLAELLILWLRLLWERCHKGPASDAGRISHGPALILEAIDQGIEQLLDVLPEWFFVCLISTRYFGAELTDAGAGGLSHRVVVGL